MKIIVSVIFIVLNFSLFAQQNINVFEEYKNSSDESLVYMLAAGDSTSHVQTELSDSMKRYIIEFTEPPLYANNVKNSKLYSLKSNNISDIDIQHERFTVDYKMLTDAVSSSLKSVNIKSPSSISHRFKKVFNGVSLVGNDEIIRQIEKLTYVKRVHIDNVIRMNDDYSNEAIKADKVWQDYGASGKGVVIGIIDTGIDSTHQELSGGKVIGGYDFVNDDDDPMDDNGHGTHCAGIAAAKGIKIKGVAPDAKLMAIKVLNERAGGYASTVIAGIEYATDPDSNPETQDGCDIINLSLGGIGVPDDPVSIAVNNAFHNDILVVVSAGNSGSEHYTIGVPGCAVEALTVGSVSNNSIISNFSSRGPSKSDFGIKPNILAPGNSINSSYLNNEYKIESGTSMAAPHVAGAAALIKELFPERNAEQIRSSLIHSSIDIGHDIWAQGNGMLDLEKAVTIKSSISKSSINFGAIEADVDFWEKTDTFFIHNLSQSDLNYQLQINDKLPSQIDIAITPSDFSIVAGDSQMVVLKANVDNKNLPFPSSDILTYNGSITINDGHTISNLLFSIIKNFQLKIHFDFEPKEMLILGDNYEKSIYKLEGEYFSILIPTRVVDIMIKGEDRYIVRENVDLLHTRNLIISKEEAKNEVLFKGLDQNGKELKLVDNGKEFFLHVEYPNEYYRSVKGFKYRSTIVHNNNNELVEPSIRYFSDFSDKYEFGISLLSYPSTNKSKEWYNIPFFIKGLNTSKTIVNDPEKFVQVNFNYQNFDEKEDSMFSVHSWGGYGIFGLTKQYEQTERSYNIIQLKNYRETFHYPTPYVNFEPLNYYAESAYPPKMGQNDFVKDSCLFLSTRYECSDKNDSIVFRFEQRPYRFFDLNRPIEIKYFQGPLHFAYSFYFDYSTPNEMTLRKYYSFFAGQWNDVIKSDVQFEVFENQKLIRKEKLFNNTSYVNYEKAEISYSYKTDYQFRFQSGAYLIYKKEGRTSSNFYFNHSGEEDYYTGPVDTYKFQIINGIGTTNIIRPNTDNNIYLESGAKNIFLYLKKDNEQNWKQFYANYDFDNNDLISIPDSLSYGYYSLKLTGTSTSYDSIVHLFEPAFYVASDLTIDSLALVELFMSTQGENWLNSTNWLSGPLVTWHGVLLENNRVVGLSLSSNNLTGTVTAQIKQLTGLKNLNIRDNNITNLPNISELVALSITDIGENYLSFDDVIPLVGMSNLTYSPQKIAKDETNVNITKGDSFSINTNINFGGCEYSWYKDDVLLEGVNSVNLSIQNVTIENQGIYFCMITNDLAPELKIKTNPTTVTVNPRLFVARNFTAINRNNSKGVNWVDIDNDGDQDLYVLNDQNSNELYKNMLSETDSAFFIDITDEFIGKDEAKSLLSSWGDVNNDGFPDMFLINKLEDSNNALYINNKGENLRKMNTPSITTYNRNTSSVNLIDYNNDGWLDIFLTEDNYINCYGQEHNLLFQNNGDISFNPISLDLSSSSFYSYSFWCDLDNDSDQDLILEENNSLAIFKYKNGEFERTQGFFNNDIKANDINFVDIDNDGDLDLFVGYSSLSSNLGIQYPKTRIFLNEQGRYNTILDSLFLQTAIGIVGSNWADLDNDGDLDLVLLSSNNSITHCKNLLQELGQLKFEILDYGISSLVIDNPETCAFADYDNDGDLDLYIAGNSTVNKLFENITESHNNWINIKCVGKISNASAIGATIKLKAKINGRDCWQLRTISSQNGNASQNSMNLEFGLGDASIIDSIQIFWPSGIYWDTTNVNVNQLLVLTEKVNNMPRVIEFNDTIITENIPFSNSYEIINKTNTSLEIEVLSIPSWLSFSNYNDSIVFSGTPNDNSPRSNSLVISVKNEFLITPVIYSLNIYVENVNEAPFIVGQKPLAFNKEGYIKIIFDYLIVEDVDDTYPVGFELIINEGSGYSVTNDTILNLPENSEQLYVPIQVNDGELNSNVFNLVIDVSTNSNLIESSGFKVYPIPFKNRVTLTCPFRESIKELDCFDITGKKVNPNIYWGKEIIEFDFSNQKQSFFILRITTNRKIFTYKLMRKQ